MNEGKIRIKSSRAILSLSQRMFIISLFVFIIPLLIHSVYLYWEEYKSSLSDARENIVFSAEADLRIVENRIAFAWRLLDQASVFGENFRKEYAIFDAEFPQGLPDRFAYIDPTGKFLFVGLRKGAASAWMIRYNVTEILSELSVFENTAIPLETGFVDRQGRLLAGKRLDSSLIQSFPVRGAQFFLTLSIQEKAIKQLHKEWYFFHFLSVLFFVGGLGGLCAWLMTRRIAKPLKQLCSVMGRVGEGAVHVRYQADSMGFEINELGRQFNETLDQLLAQMEQTEQEKLGRERLAEELKIGRTIQSGLLPTQFPALRNLAIAAGFVPAREVGGDFYDVFPFGENKVMIAIADTAGKGVSACLYALGLRSTLRALSAQGTMKLSELVAKANHLFLEDAGSTGMFATLWLGIYHEMSGKLEYCNQGHPPAYVMRDGTLTELSGQGIALGVEENETIIVKQEILRQGDVLILYTDGVIEAHDLRNQLFGSDRLQKILRSDRKRDPAQIVSDVFSAVEEFSRNAPQHDDLTLLIIKSVAN